MRRPALSYANVISTLGVFIALGGTSYAVTKLPKNSVGSDQLRAASVTNGKVADGAITSNKLAPGTAMTGPRGPRGARGPDGATGPSGPVDVIVRRRDPYLQFSPLAGGSIEAARLTLPAGKWLVTAITVVISPASNNDAFRCALSFNGAQWGFDEAAELGGSATPSAIISVVGTSDSPAPVTATMRCWHDNALTVDPGVAYPPRVERVRLIATRATTLDVADL